MKEVSISGEIIDLTKTEFERLSLLALHSIFNNLTENAIRYAVENIKINVSVFGEDNVGSYCTSFCVEEIADHGKVGQ